MGVGWFARAAGAPTPSSSIAAASSSLQRPDVSFAGVQNTVPSTPGAGGGGDGGAGREGRGGDGFRDVLFGGVQGELRFL